MCACQEIVQRSSNSRYPHDPNCISNEIIGKLQQDHHRAMYLISPPPQPTPLLYTHTTDRPYIDLRSTSTTKYSQRLGQFKPRS